MEERKGERREYGEEETKKEMGKEEKGRKEERI